MRKFIILALSIALGIANVTRAKEEKKPIVMSAEWLCSELLFNEHAFKKFEGTESVIRGRLSSIGDKRKAYLGNRMDSIVELVIKESKKEPYGKEFPGTGCYISCLVNVPGEQCEHRDGKYECKEITDPKLEENKKIYLS